MIAGKSFRDIIPDELEEDLLRLTMIGLSGSLLASLYCRHWLPAHHGMTLRWAAGFLTWITSLGTARAAALGLHVRVTFLADLVSPVFRKRMSLFADGVFMLLALAILGISCSMVHYAFTHPVAKGHPLVYSAMPVGMLLTIIRLCQRLNRTWRERA